MKASEFNMYALSHQKQVTRELREKCDRLEEQYHQARNAVSNAWNAAGDEARRLVGCKCKDLKCTCGAVEEGPEERDCDEV